MIPALTLYGHDYCHLCHEMLDALAPMRGVLGFEVEWIDIEGRPDLEERFGELVPVLMAGDDKICHYHLDVDALTRYFDRRAAGAAHASVE